VRSPEAYGPPECTCFGCVNLGFSQDGAVPSLDRLSSLGVGGVGERSPPAQPRFEEAQHRRIRAGLGQPNGVRGQCGQCAWAVCPLRDSVTTRQGVTRRRPGERAGAGCVASLRRGRRHHAVNAELHL